MCFLQTTGSASKQKGEMVSMHKALMKKVRWVRIRCSINLLIQQTGRVLGVAGGIAILIVLAEKLLAVKLVTSNNEFTLDSLSPWPLIGLLLSIILVIIVLWTLKLPTNMQLALLIDERLNLRERFSTSLALANSHNPFAQAAIVEANNSTHNLKLREKFPLRLTSGWLYGAGIWLTVVILISVLPQYDLLGSLRKKEQQQKKVQQAQKAQAEVKQTTKTVKLAVQRMDQPELADALAQLDRLPEGLKPQAAKIQAIRKLGDLSDQIKKMSASKQMDSLNIMEQMLKRLHATPDAFSQKLTLALAKGNFDQAAKMLQQMQQKINQGELSDQQKKDLTRQLQNLAQQLQQMAQEKKELEKELEKQGLNKKLAQLNEKQLRQALNKKGLSSEKIEELMQKAAACRSAASRCGQLGQAMAACGGGSADLAGDDLDSLTDQLNELERLQEQIKLTQASLDEINQAMQCLGQGMCQGPGRQGPFSQQGSLNPGSATGNRGIGYGPRNTAENGQTATKKTKIKNKPQKGPIIASWYFKGTQVKGQAQRDFANVVQAGRENAAEAISEKQIPRKYEDSVKKYFSQLDGISQTKPDKEKESQEF